MKKFLRLMLITCLIASLSFTGVFAQVNSNSVVTLVDNTEMRVVKANIDGEVAVVTYHKLTGDFTFEGDGKVQKVSGNDIEKAQNKYKQTLAAKSTITATYTSSNFLFGSSRKLLISNDIHSLGYKKYWEEDSSRYYWELNGPGIWNSISRYEEPGNKDIIDDFKSNIDTSEEYWVITKGALIGAGASAIVGIILALLPEAVVSKAGATAALVAAGASASAALAAGGSYYTSNVYYHKAEDAYNSL